MEIDIITLRLVCGTAKEQRSVTVHINRHTPIVSARSQFALICGVTSDLADKLKMDAVPAGSTSGNSLDSGTPPASLKPNKNRSKRALASHSKTTALSLLPGDETSLHELKVSNGDDIVIENWNKIGSGIKWDISKLFQTMIMSEFVLTQEFVSFVGAYDNLSAEASKRTFQFEYATPFGSTFLELCEKLGAEVCTADMILFPQQRRSRRMQLVGELFAHHSDNQSCYGSITYQDVSRASPKLKINSEDDVKSNSPSSAQVSRSAPVRLVRNPSHNNRHRRSNRVDEEVKYFSLPQEYEILELEMQFEMEDDAPINDVLATGNSNSRRERRRRRQERSRISSNIATQSSLQFAFDGDMLYEDLVQLENVPVGAKHEFVSTLPVQVLRAVDINIMKRNHGSEDSCRICLGEFCEAEEVMRLPCMHLYHKVCIAKWLQTNNKCPQDMIPVETDPQL
eukprot:TRINITY_DN4450_c0_g1_i1.p1 TRINITY_DN4450_c0_g1~~TRINITY_DN4450_c0_g1_i1.p1  ORF type:complete len:470 (+),score=89.25 TRINITY_DN4450_c0_g1_i1:51-1412(+)